MALSPAHRTLVANTVTTVTFDTNYGYIEVLSDGTADLYVSTDGTDPVIGADGYHLLFAGAASSLEVRDHTIDNTVVKLISAGSPKVSVRGL